MDLTLLKIFLILLDIARYCLISPDIVRLGASLACIFVSWIFLAQLIHRLCQLVMRHFFQSLMSPRWETVSLITLSLSFRVRLSEGETQYLQSLSVRVRLISQCEGETQCDTLSVWGWDSVSPFSVDTESKGDISKISDRTRSPPPERVTAVEKGCRVRGDNFPGVTIFQVWHFPGVTLDCARTWGEVTADWTARNWH